MTDSTEQGTHIKNLFLEQMSFFGNARLMDFDSIISIYNEIIKKSDYHVVIAGARHSKFVSHCFKFINGDTNVHQYPIYRTYGGKQNFAYADITSFYYPKKSNEDIMKEYVESIWKVMININELETLGEPVKKEQYEKSLDKLKEIKNNIYEIPITLMMIVQCIV